VELDYNGRKGFTRLGDAEGGEVGAWG